MKTILPIIALILLSGCKTTGQRIAGFYEADPLFMEQSKLLVDKDNVDLDGLNGRVEEIAKVAMKDDSKSKRQSRLMRNDLIEDLLTISDRSCARHQASIMANLSSWNVGAGTLSSFLSAIGTVAGGESTKAALAAGAGFTNSTRSLVNEEIYAKALGTTIVRATMIARKKQMAKISAGMQEELQTYSVKAALRDVYNYQNKCSFYYGLVEVTKALDERKMSESEIESKIAKLKGEKEYLNKKGIKTPEIDTQLPTLSAKLGSAQQE